MRLASPFNATDRPQLHVRCVDCGRRCEFYRRASAPGNGVVCDLDRTGAVYCSVACAEHASQEGRHA